MVRYVMGELKRDLIRVETRFVFMRFKNTDQKVIIILIPFTKLKQKRFKNSGFDLITFRK